MNKSVMSDFAQFSEFIVVGIILVIFGYALVRGMSFAYFRTKREHYQLLKEMRKQGKGDSNGV